MGQKIGKKGCKVRHRVLGKRKYVLGHKIGRRISPLCSKGWNKTGMCLIARTRKTRKGNKEGKVGKIGRWVRQRLGIGLGLLKAFI